MTKAGSWWYRTIAGTGLQSTGQTAAIMSMVIHQIRNGTTTVFLRQIKFSAGILLDMVMLYVGMWPAATQSERLN